MFLVLFLQFLQRFDIFQNKNIWEGRLPVPEQGPPFGDSDSVGLEWGLESAFFKESQVVRTWFRASPSLEGPPEQPVLLAAILFLRAGQVLPSLHTSCFLCLVCCRLFLCLTPTFLSGLSPNFISSRKASYKPLNQPLWYWLSWPQGPQL